jgi:hypothetical protein
MLPLPNEELLEVLVLLSNDEDEGVRTASYATIETLKPESFVALAGDNAAPPEVLGFLCVWTKSSREIVEAVVFNRSTPAGALAHIAARSNQPTIIEAIALNQQALIRAPEIIDSILANPARTPEAERRVKEVREEFFEKEFGAQMVAQEQKVREEAERAAQEAQRDTVTVSSLEDLIQLGLIEEGVDDSVVAEYEMEFGPFDIVEPEPEERLDIEEILTDAEADLGQIPPDRMPVYQRIALMSVKDRVMLALKGTREARMILVRDPNRLIAGAVLRNPRITDMEVESISSIKTVPEDVLRQIGMNRAWTRSYTVIHNLVRNPRTPIATTLGFLNRILTRDLRALSTNKNIPDVIRTTSARMYLKRQGA